VPIQLVLGQLNLVLDFGALFGYNEISKRDKMQYPTDFTPELKRKPICGVLSVAMTAGVTFKRATEVIKKNLMPFQKRHGGKTYIPQRCNALKELGVAFKEIPLPRRMTLATYVRNYCKPFTTYMITTSRHVVTVKNRIICDQIEIAHIDMHNARRCFVCHVLEII
jgi:hypothetical protein